MRSALGGVLVLAALILADGARAGSYEVRSCAASQAKRSDAWSTSVVSGNAVLQGDWCVDGQTGGYENIDLSGGRWRSEAIHA